MHRSNSMIPIETSISNRLIAPIPYSISKPHLHPPHLTPLCPNWLLTYHNPIIHLPLEVLYSSTFSKSLFGLLFACWSLMSPSIYCWSSLCITGSVKSHRDIVLLFEICQFYLITFKLTKNNPKKSSKFLLYLLCVVFLMIAKESTIDHPRKRSKIAQKTASPTLYSWTDCIIDCIAFLSWGLRHSLSNFPHSWTVLAL